MKQEVRQSQRAAYSKGTFKNLKTQITSYLLFCEYFEIVALPASVETLCLYVQFLGRSMKSVQSIRNYLNGVKIFHIFKECEFPSLHDVQIRLTLRGLGKMLFHTPKQAAPITPEILIEIWRVLDFSKPIHSTFWCMCLFAFFMMARKSSIAPPSEVEFDTAKYLCRYDIILTSFGLQVNLKYSKTNQFGDKNILLPMYALPDSPLCPVRAFKLMCTLVPAPSEAPAFCRICHGSIVPIHAAALDRFLKAVLKLAVIDNPSQYTMHSFRRGAASFYFKAGVSGEIIQLFGNWASDCYLRYLRFSRESLLNAASLVSERIGLL